MLLVTHCLVGTFHFSIPRSPRAGLRVRETPLSFAAKGQGEGQPDFNCIVPAEAGGGEGRAAGVMGGIRLAAVLSVIPHDRRPIRRGDSHRLLRRCSDQREDLLISEDS